MPGCSPTRKMAPRGLPRLRWAMCRFTWRLVSPRVSLRASPRIDALLSPRAFALLVLALLQLGLQGACAHYVNIETTPPGAMVHVDGKNVGVSPVRLEQRTGVHGSIVVRLELEGYDTLERRVARDEFYMWPALVSAIPLLAAPTVLIPVAGPFICGGWFCATSPACAGIAMTRKVPDVLHFELTKTRRRRKKRR